MATQYRELARVTVGSAGSDGDGVKLTRLIGNGKVDMLDPFLLLDSFESNQPQDYIGGFPSHPHRGFETVTYMLAGKMRHKDSMGNEGVIEPNGVQWMTAGKGIVHSEMPEQTDGLLHGLQLWVNLPRSEKMTAPAYQEFDAKAVTKAMFGQHSEVRIVSGQVDSGAKGVVENQYVKPTYLDVSLHQEDEFLQSLPVGDNAFIFVINGSVKVGQSDKTLRSRQLGILTQGDLVKVEATEADTRFVLVSAKPLNEPVFRGGPFVMSTKRDLMQAFYDYQNNQF